MAKRKHKRVSKSLQVPFTTKKLKAFAKAIPKNSRVRLVTTTPAGLNAPKPKTFLEADWLVPIESAN